MRPLDLLTEQLWGPAMGEGAVRLQVGGVNGAPPTADWVEQESYWMFPSADAARLLLPRGPRQVTASAATNYRGLRRPGKNLGRTGLGLLARAGAPVSASTLSVQVKAERADVAAGLPLRLLADALGVQRVHAATGVRSGANRKATLHLLARDGTPLGYAKLGWSEASDQLVRTEGAALREVGGRARAMRAPALLAEVDYHGHPVIVTEPLPPAVRGARDKALRPPSSEEIFSLCPVHRHAPIPETGHFQNLEGRLSRLAGTAVTADVVGPALAVAAALRERRVTVPVTTRWHGDLAPWNRARERGGQLWVWDWESSEPDAVAGLDAVHWAFSVRRPASGRYRSVKLDDTLADAAGHLTAAGVPRRLHGDVAAVYALTVVERAADLAARSGSWDRLWIGSDDLRTLVAQAAAQLDQPSRRPR